VSARVVAVDPDDARRAAQRILSGGRYRTSSAPHPLRKPLNWLGDRLDTIGTWIGHLLRPLVNPWVLVAVLLAVLAAAVFFVTRARGRRSRPGELADGRLAPTAAEDPDALERAADDAERAGDLDRALRLRFRAGLLRLGDGGAIRYRPSVTTGEVRRVLGSETFDDLARTFEGVAYGGRDAQPPDVETARREWPNVLAGAARRSDGS